ncbi:MAG: cyclase family protein [Cyanobacteria bacterium SZAS LIN-2]|nr:cyclase family protein [Cyanobacteria bacterium SZAS LIN-2]
MAKRKIVDLSHKLQSGTADFHNKKDAFQYVCNFTVAKDGFAAGSFTMPEHFGTHVDAPLHFNPDGLSIDQIPAEKLIVPLYVIDLQLEVQSNPDYCLTLDRLHEFEKDGAIEPGAVVACCTGWGARWDRPDSYRNADTDGVMHFPGYSPEAARFLVEERGVVGMGIDTLSIDFGASTTYEVHRRALGQGIFLIENLANLEQLPARHSTVFLGALPIAGGTGAPARILAVAD